MREEVEALATAFSKAFTNREVDTLLGFYTDDAVILPPNGPRIEGRAAMKAVVESYYDAGAETLELHPVDVSEAGDRVIEIGRYVLTIRPPGADSILDNGKYVVVYSRGSDGSLKIATDIWNSDTPLPEG
jgi:ketosteroid isomerase-like protein